ncbi:MAG: hypothetical protein N2Z72_05000 [Bacteroidales bacterium]|nr:hypothetical protein [Bacteroidales bacterium]
MKNRFGVIDIGSNAIKCFVGMVVEREGIPRVIREMYARIPIRLGDDVFSWNEILPTTHKKMQKGMLAFAQLLSLWEVERSIMVGTSAMRDSTNGKEIFKNLSETIGIKGMIISGKEEAELVLNLLKWYENPDSQKIIFDIGGGSLEVNFIQPNGKIRSESFKLGAVRLLKNAVEPQEIEKMFYFIEKHLLHENIIPMAVGGNIDALKSFFGKKNHDKLYLDEIQNAFHSLINLTKEERIEKFFLPADRADVIVPAAHLFMTIMKKFSLPYLFIPKVGLSDAVALALYQGKY